MHILGFLNKMHDQLEAIDKTTSFYRVEIMVNLNKDNE